MIDNELPAPKTLSAEAHEIGHSLLDWHETFLHGDPKHKHFSQLDGDLLFMAITPACGYTRRGPLGSDEVPLTDDN